MRIDSPANDMAQLSRIGVLYESDEWSDHKLAAELADALTETCGDGAPVVEMIDMMRDGCIECALGCDMLVSRVFASARFRGHDAALAHMERLVGEAEARGIPMVNEGRAHRYEVSKVASTRALAEAGLLAPTIIAFGMPEELDASAFVYPCIIKPDCGGRSTHTLLAHDEDEAKCFIAQAPAMPFVVQEYVEPEFGYVTRIEVVDDELPLIAKRSIGDGGLSSYHAGSTYKLFPDCPDAVRQAALRAAAVLGIGFGSFDVIETRHGAYFIDANSVSNVSEDCTEMFGFDLMRAHARGMARRYCQMRSDSDNETVCSGQSVSFTGTSR